MTASTTSADSALQTKTALLSVFGVFATNGLLLGAFGGSLAALRVKLQLEDLELAGLLLTSGLFAILSMQVAGRLVDSKEPSAVTTALLPIMILGIAMLGIASTSAVALIGAAFVGLGNGGMDVAMNALGVEVEKARKRAMMSRFHAFFSIGSFTGAGLVLAIAKTLNLDGASLVTPALLVTACVATAAYVCLNRVTPRVKSDEPGSSGPASHHGIAVSRSKIAWLLGALALSIGLTEGTAVDWSSVHVVDVAHVSPADGALGLASVSLFMVLIRLAGDAVVDRLGRSQAIRIGAMSAFVGYALTLSSGSLPLLLLGWALVGAGVGLIGPQIYAAAGRIGGGRALALVVSCGYSAFLIGPAVIGILASERGVQQAMILPAGLALCVILLSNAVPNPTRGD